MASPPTLHSSPIQLATLSPRLVATASLPPKGPGGGHGADSGAMPIPISPRPAPPTPQEIERRLGAPATVVSSLNLADARDQDLQRRLSTGTGRRMSVGSSGMSSAEEDEDVLGSPSRAPLPLSAISEASDGNASGSDSDASSIGPGASSRANAQPFVPSSVERALDRVRSSGDSTRMSDSVAVKSGYLMKKGERRKAWKKRWFVLRGGQVAMYKNDKEYQLLRLIPLSEIHTCAPIEFKKHAFTFGIVTPKRTYYVKAGSNAEVHDWCTKVELAKEEVKAMATVTSLETGDVTPQGMRTPVASIPIPSLSAVVPPTPGIPIRRPSQGYSYTTTATSPSPPSHFTPPSASVLSSSFTSTSTAPTNAHTNPRVPPNSFAAGGAGALALETAELELGGVDAGLESVLGAQQRRTNSFSGSAGGGTSSSGEGTTGSSRLTVPTPGYFNSCPDYGSPVSPGASVAPSSPGGGIISSSEDEDGYDGYDNISPILPISASQLKFQDATRPDEARRSNGIAQAKLSANTIDGAGGIGDPNKVILSGYLMKQGKRRNWRKRWFILLSGGLMYSRSHMDTKIHRQIPLSEILDAIELDPEASSRRRDPISVSTGGQPSAPPFEGGAKNYEHCFKIITPKRTYLVCAPSEEDEIAWLAALQCLVQRKQAAAPLPGTAGGVSTPANTSPKRAPAGAGAEAAMSPPRAGGRTPSFEVRREASTTTATPTATPVHGRHRSVTDAAKAAVREGVMSFREGGGRPRPEGDQEQRPAVRA